MPGQRARRTGRRGETAARSTRAGACQRDVDLYAELEAEQILGPGSVADQVVERGEEGGTRCPCAVAKLPDQRQVLGVDVPRPAKRLFAVDHTDRQDRAGALQLFEHPWQVSVPAADEVVGDVAGPGHAKRPQ